MKEILDTKQKALKINLDPTIYGSFAEIGAGQEVARHFFTAGAASGTIAKSMSAYDMAFSDSIYGEEPNKRYVSENRLIKMLEHEYVLLEERLTSDKYHNKTFFSFANTVTTINYAKTNDSHGWIGIRFQLAPKAEWNEIHFHVRLLDLDAGLQQNVIGILGTNLIYAAYFLNKDTKAMIESLVDNLHPSSIEIDMIKIKGPDFKDLNNVLLNLYLVAKGFSSAAVFCGDGNVNQVQNIVYKKDVIIYRRRYSQKQPIDIKKFKASIDFIKEQEVINDDNLSVITEISLDNGFLMADGTFDLTEILSRVELLLNKGRAVMVSNFTHHDKFCKFINRFKSRKTIILYNMVNLLKIFDVEESEISSVRDHNRFVMNYVNELTSSNVNLYMFPYYSEKAGKIITCKNMPVNKDQEALFKFLLHNKFVTDVPIEYLYSSEASNNIISND